MTIQDAIAEVVYRRVLAHPELCPLVLVEQALKYKESGASQELRATGRRSAVWDTFLRKLHEHSGEISEILCTENGQDARKD